MEALRLSQCQSDYAYGSAHHRNDAAMTTLCTPQSTPTLDDVPHPPRLSPTTALVHRSLNASRYYCNSSLVEPFGLVWFGLVYTPLAVSASVADL